MAASGGKRRQAAASGGKRRQAAASGGKRRQAAASGGKRRQAAASGGKRRHILHGCLHGEPAVKESLTRLSHQGLTHSFLLARLLGSGLGPATVQPALPILLAGLTLGAAAHAQTAPTIRSISITSSPASGQTYRLGEIIRIRVTLSDTVDFRHPGGSLSLRIGSETRSVSTARDAWSNLTDDGISVNDYAYTVQDGDLDTNGISIPEDPITLQQGIYIRSTNTNVDADLSYAGLSDQSAHKVDGSVPASVEVSSDALTVGEGDAGTYTVKLSKAPTADVTIAITKESGGDADLSVAPTSLTFTTTTWDTGQTVTVTASTDTDSSYDKATFKHTASSTDTGFNDLTASVVVQADTRLPRLSIILTEVTGRQSIVRSGSFISVNENAGTVVTDVTLSRPSTSPVTVDYATAAITSSHPILTTPDRAIAIAGEDYSATSGTLTFAPGDLKKTISVPIIDDSLFLESDRFFEVVLSNPSSGASLSDTQEKVLISLAEDDPAPTMTVAAAGLSATSPGRLSVKEGDSGTTEVTFTVTQNQRRLPRTRNLDVQVVASRTTAAAGSDFAALDTNTRLEFAAGEASKTFTVTINGDTTAEEDETIGLSFLSGNGNFINSASVFFDVTITILDDDDSPSAPAAPALTAGNAQLSVQWSAPTDDGGVAITDYDVRHRPTTPSDSSWTELADTTDSTATTATISSLTNGTVYEVQVRAQNENGAGDWSASAEATPSTMTLSYTAAPTTLTVNTAITTLTATTSGVTGTIAYTANPSLPAGLSLNASTGAISGTPTAKSTSPVTVTVTATAGSTTAKAGILFPAVAGEPLATPVVTLDVDNGRLIANWAAVTGVNNYVLQWKASTVTDWAMTGVTTVNAGGSSSTRYVIPVLTNGTAYDVRVQAKAASASTTRADSAWSAAVSATPTMPTLSIAVVTKAGVSKVGRVILIEEEAGTVDFTVTLSAASTMMVTVDYATEVLPDNDQRIDAIAGEDYAAVMGTLTFAPGETSKTISVQILDDTVYEEDEFFRLGLSNPSAATIAANRGRLTLNIINLDPVPPVTVTAEGLTSTGKLSVPEGDADADITFTFTQASAAERAIVIGSFGTDGTATATADTDFEVPSESLSIAAGQTQVQATVKIKGDTDEEDDETFDLLLNRGDGIVTNSGGARFRIEVTILDDDGVPAAPAAPRLASSASGQLTASWLPPTDTGGVAITDYDVRYRVNSGSPKPDWTEEASTTAASTALMRDIGSLVGGTEYEVQVRAQNENGEGAWSPSATATPSTMLLTYASQPTTLRVGDTITDITATVTGFTGTPTYGYAVTSGTLPPGLTLSSTTGTISGTPTTANASRVIVTITVTAGSETASTNIVLPAVLPPSLSIMHVPGSGTFSMAGGVGREFLSVDEEGDTVVVQVLLSSASLAPVTVEYVTEGIRADHPLLTGAGTGIATAGEDYVAQSGTLTFAPGQTRQTITILLIDDDIDEGSDEFFRIRLSNPTGATLPSGRDILRVGIGNADISAPVTITAEGLTSDGSRGRLRVVEGDTGNTEVTFTITLAAPNLSSDFFINSLTDTFNEHPKTATLSGSDKDLEPFSATRPRIPKGMTTATVTLPIIGDTRVEGDETTVLELSRGDNGIITNVGGTKFFVELTIVDDDGVPAAPAAPVLVPKGAGLDVSWLPPTDTGGMAITDYDVRHGVKPTSGDPATWTELTDTSDSTALSATISGLTNGTAYVVQVRAQNENGNGAWSASATATPSTMTLSYTTPPTTLTVNTPITALTATTSGVSGTIAYTVSPALPPGLSLNATNGTISGTPTTVSTSPTRVTVTATAGSNTATAGLIFPAVDKALLAAPANLVQKSGTTPTKSGFAVTWDAVSNAVGYTATATSGFGSTSVMVTSPTREAVFTGLRPGVAYTVTVTATGNANYADSPASTALSLTTLTNSAPSITAIANQMATVGTDLLVDVDATDADAGDTLQYRATSSDATVATVSPTARTNLVAASQVTVTPVSAGTVTITVMVRDGATAVTELFKVTVMEDSSSLSFSTTTLTVAEGGSNTYTVELATQPRENVTVALTVDGSTDVTVSPPSLTFTMSTWDTAQTVTVSAAQDTDSKDDTATVNHAASGQGYASVTGSVTVTVDDDEIPNVVPSITPIADQTATFGTDLRVNVDATDADDDPLQYQASSGDTTVATVSPTALTAHSNTSQVTVTPVGAGTATITVTVSDDEDTQTETFDVVVSRATLGMTRVTLARGNGQLTPSWEAVTGAATYALQHKLSSVTGWSGSGVTTVDPATSGTAITGLTNETAYDVRVRAKAASSSTTYVDGLWSGSTQATPTATPVPTALGASFFRDPADTSRPNFFIPGETVEVLVDLNNSRFALRPIGGTVRPRLALTVGSETRYATYFGFRSGSRRVSGSQGSLVFEYTFTGEDRDADGISVPENAIDLPPGLRITAQDDATLDAVLEFAGTEVDGVKYWVVPDSTRKVDNTPLKASGLTLAKGSEPDKVVVTWKATYAPNGYSVRWRKVGSNVQSVLSPLNSVPGTPVLDGDGNPTLKLSYEITGLESDTAYIVRLDTRNRANNGVQSKTNLAKRITTAEGPPSAPAAPTVTPENEQLTVNWIAPTNNGGSAITDYDVRHRPTTPADGAWTSLNDAGSNATDTSTTAIITGLTNGTEYEVQVRAQNANGEGFWSASVREIAGDVSLRYTAVPDTLMVGTMVSLTATATGFDSTPSYATTGSLPAGLTINGSTGAITGTLTTATTSTPTVTVTATAVTGTDTQTATANITFPAVDKGTLATPTGLALKAATRSKTGFTVTWTTVENATGYTATATPSGGTAVAGTVDTTGTNPEAVFTGLAVNTTYMVSVVATGNTANYLSSTAATLSQTTSANSAPTVATIPDQTATVGVAFSFTLPAGTFSDADSGDSLTYTAMQTDGTTDSMLPTWLSFTAGTGVFSGTPTSTDTGTLSVKVTASDGTASVSDTFDIVVNVPPALTFSKDSLTVDEGGSNTYTVALAVQPTENVTVTVSGSSGVTVSPASLTFTSITWNTAQTVTVTAAQDDDAGDDTATVNHTASGGSYNSVTGSVAVTVEDDDTPALEFTPTSVVVNEGVGSSNYTVALATQPSATVTVTVGGTTSTDLTVDTNDNATGNQSTLTFTTTDWSTAQTVMVSAAEDADTVDDRVTLSHTVTGGDYGSVTGNLMVRVDDDDSPGLVFKPTALTVDEGGSATYTLALATQPAGNVTVTVGGTTNNDVTVDTDTGTAGTQDTLTFSNSTWNTPQTVTVNAASDDDTTDDSVTLTHATTGYDSVSEDLMVTVDDDDQSLTYSAAPTTLTVGTSITALTATATGFDSTPSYAVTTGSLPAGLTISAITGEITGAPTAASTSTTTVTVTATVGTGTDTQTATANITFPAVGKGTLATPTGLALKASTQSKTGFTVTWTAVENATNYTATATPSNGTAVDGTVDITGTNPEAVFTGLAANTTYTVSVMATGNTDNYLSSAAATLSQPTSANSAPTVANAIDDPTAATVGTAFSFTLPEDTFSDADSGDSLTYTAMQTDGTTDSALPTWLIFTAGTGVFSGTPTSTDTGTLSVKVTANDGTASVSATFNIVVNVPPALTFSKDSLTVDEDGSNTYTVALAAPPTENVTVAVTVSGSSDVTVSPASLIFTSTTWNTAQTVTVTAAPDADSEDDTATVNHAASGGGYNSVTGSVPVTVDDADTPALEFTPTSVVVNEGVGSSEYTVALATQPSATVTVTVGGWSNTDVSVDTNDNATGNQNTLTFTTTDWRAAQTVMVSATEDADTVDDMVTLSHTVTGGDYGSVTGNLAVRVDDKDSPGLVFTPTALTVDEGGSDTYTVALATQPAGDVTVTVGGTTNSDVTVDTGTVGTQDTLTFSNSTWNMAQTVTVSAADDADTTDDSVTLTHTTTGYNSVSDNLMVTVDDDDQSLTYSAAPTTLTVGTPITALTATATGFDSTPSYAVTTDSLPAGLTINESTGAITGAPTAASTSMTTVTVTATAGTGTDTQTATADITFPAVGKGTLATPTGLALKPDTRSKTGFTVTWTAVENATGYMATAVQGSNSFMVEVNVTEATFTGLAMNTTYTVSVVAKDNTANYNDSPAGTLRLSTAANQAPTVANMIPDQSATVDTGFSFTVPANTFSDADGDTLTYRATKADDMALPAWLTFNPDARTFSGTPASTDIGTLMVKVTVSDGNGSSISDTFNIMVSTTAANQAPTVANMIPDQSATVDTEFSFNVPANTFSDADGDTLTYRATKADDMALPAWLTFNPDARTFSGTPTSTDIGTLMVKVTASDGNGGSISDTFNIMVSTTAANQAPTVANMIPDQSATVDTEFSFNVPANTFSDADGDTLTYRATKADDMALPAWLTFNPNALTFSGTPTSTDTGTLMVKVTASDGNGGSISDTFNIMVSTTAANQAPTVANMIPDQSATVDMMFSFNVPANTFSDADGDTLTYRATKADDMALPAWLTFNPDARTFSGTPTSTDIGTLMVKVTASDGNGGSISDTFNIMVSTTTANQAPTVANMIPDQSATVDTEFSFTVPANTFSDADGDTLTYRATKADDMALPAWLTFNPDARTFSGTPTSTDIGTLMVKVIASDGNGGSISDTFNIMVSTTTANQEMKEKLEAVNEEITPSIVNEVVGRQMASITDRFATISSGFHMDSLSMEEVVTDVADYLFSHHQDIQANGFDWRQALSGHNFSFALADTSVSQDSMDDGESSSSGSGPVSFWGGIDYSSLEDRIEPFSLDGDITSFNFGVDKEFTSDLIAGVLLSIANSEFELAEDSTDSTYEVDIFTVNPYISWETSDELSLWASVGYGRGHTDLTDDSTNDTFSQGGNFIRFSAGGRFQLWSSEAGTALALKLDGATAHFLEADVQRSRLATELSHDFSIESGVLNTALELGLLMSSADESAAELVGGLHWQGDAGLSSSIRSRILLGGGDRQEWGIGGALRYTAGGDGEGEGEGLVVSLEPSFGISNPQLLSELWSATRLDLAVTREAPTAQLNVKLAYGFPTSAGLLTPYTDLSFSETTNTYVTGLRYGLPTGWNLNLKGTHKTSTTDAENTILLELRSDL